MLCCMWMADWGVDWLAKCCRLTGAYSGVLVPDGAPPAGLEDARWEGGPELVKPHEAWGGCWALQLLRHSKLDNHLGVHCRFPTGITLCFLYPVPTGRIRSGVAV